MGMSMAIPWNMLIHGERKSRNRKNRKKSSEKVGFQIYDMH